MAVVVFNITTFFLHFTSEMHCKAHIIPSVICCPGQPVLQYDLTVCLKLDLRKILAKCSASEQKLIICGNQERTMSQLYSASQLQMFYTHSWLSTQEDVQIPNHTVRWSHLNWCLLSSSLPLCMVIRSSPLLSSKAVLRWHWWPSAWSVSIPPSPHGHSWTLHGGSASRWGCLLWVSSAPQTSGVCWSGSFWGQESQLHFGVSNEHYRRMWVTTLRNV